MLNIWCKLWWADTPLNWLGPTGHLYCPAITCKIQFFYFGEMQCVCSAIWELYPVSMCLHIQNMTNACLTLLHYCLDLHYSLEKKHCQFSNWFVYDCYIKPCVRFSNCSCAIFSFLLFPAGVSEDLPLFVITPHLLYKSLVKAKEK